MSVRRRLLAPLLSGLLALTACTALTAVTSAPAARAASHHGKVSFTQAQQQFNCTICHEPLNEARSAEAYQENALLRRLIARGDTLGQIKRTMIANYGIAVLANPPKKGFAVLIVVVPVAVIALAVTTGAAQPARAATHRGRVSFTQAQRQFNCTICHEPLNEARSAEAYQENALLRQLIAHGDTMGQIKRAMVANYGVSVLANPPKRGFAVLIVVIPVVVIVLGLFVLAYTIPRWRRRAAEQARRPQASAPTISDADEQRLAADLARRD